MRSLAEEWDARSGDWERWTRTPGHDLHFERYNWPAFTGLLPAPGRATLDLGCGEGRGGARLRELGHVVTGLDASPALAALAAERGVYEDVVVADAAALPFGDGAFDLVVAFMTLQDIEDAGAAVREAARVLEPGGRLAAAFIHPFSSSEIAPYFDTSRTEETVERDGIAFTFHQLHRPLAAWLDLFLDAGLVIETVREPAPSEDDARQHPALARSLERPLFLHVRARR
jgi:SAM-dependent methyltransferase